MAQVNKVAGSRTAEAATVEFGGWTGQLRRVLLASVGVAFLAKDEVQDLVDRLVAKGETAERDGRKLVNGLLSKKELAANGRRAIDQLEKRTRGLSRNVKSSLETAQGVTRGLASELQTQVKNRVEKVLRTMNLVSAREVSDLNHKIDQLSRKLAKLGKK